MDTNENKFKKITVKLLSLGEDTKYRAAIDAVNKTGSEIFEPCVIRPEIELEKPQQKVDGSFYYEAEYIKKLILNNVKLNDNEICIGLISYKVGDRYGGCMNVLPLGSESSEQTIFFSVITPWQMHSKKTISL